MKSWLEVFPEFEQLKNWFDAHGYKTTVEELDNYASVVVTSDEIRGAFCTPNDGESYAILQGRFAADNEKCFNKWSQCPLCVTIPTDFATLEKHLKFLASEEGFQHSTSFEYLDNRVLPFELSYD